MYLGTHVGTFRYSSMLNIHNRQRTFGGIRLFSGSAQGMRVARVVKCWKVGHLWSCKRWFVDVVYLVSINILKTHSISDVEEIVRTGYISLAHPQMQPSLASCLRKTKLNDSSEELTSLQMSSGFPVEKWRVPEIEDQNGKKRSFCFQ